MKKQTLSNEEIGGVCEGLSMLLHAGVGAGDGLALLSEEEDDPSLKKCLSQMAEQVDEGKPLAAAFRESGHFPDYVCGLLDVGEQAGRTEEAFTALAAYYEDRARMNRQIRSALLYPAILLILMLAVIGILLVRVLPVFDDVYASLGGNLTGIAGGLLRFGQALDAAMPVLCVLLGVILLLAVLFAALPSFREKIAALWNRYLGDRGVSRKINTARFAQSLSMGLSSGLPLEEAISMSSKLLDSVPTAKKRALECARQLESGVSMAEAMKKAEILPQSECRLLELGLRSGTGDTAMAQIARRLTEDSELALQELVSKVEPALVMVTSILVGLILLSVMLPLMNIMSAIG